MDQILPIIYMIGVLLLVLPDLLSTKSKLKQLLTNLSIWSIIVLIILTYIYIFKEKLKRPRYRGLFINLERVKLFC